jgi:hypothetical protein
MGEVKDTVELVVSLISKVKALSDKAFAATIYQDLMEIEESVMQQEQANITLIRENESLKGQLSTQDKLKMIGEKTTWTDGGVGIYINPRGQKEYLCHHCFDTGKLIHLAFDWENAYTCPECRQRFYLTNK